MARREFPRTIKVAVIKRSMRDGLVICEECGEFAKRFEIDHIDADGLTGKPVLENARLLCRPCHLEKTKIDVAVIARAKRREAAYLGARAPSSRPIATRSFPRSSKAMAREEKAKASPRASLPPRSLYTEAKPLTDSEKATLRAGQRSRHARGNRSVTLAKVAE
jgi:5-methylcytosine-specific restriction protein A